MTVSLSRSIESDKYCSDGKSTHQGAGPPSQKAEDSRKRGSPLPALVQYWLVPCCGWYQARVSLSRHSNPPDVQHTHTYPTLSSPSYWRHKNLETGVQVFFPKSRAKSLSRATPSRSFLTRRHQTVSPLTDCDSDLDHPQPLSPNRNKYCPWLPPICQNQQ